MGQSSNVLKLHQPKPSEKKPPSKDIFALIRNYNQGKKIKIRARKLGPNNYSLYLQFWNGNKQEYDFRKRYITGDPKQFRSDKDELDAVELYRNARWQKMTKDEGQEIPVFLKPRFMDRNLVKYYEEVMKILKERVNTYAVFKTTLSQIKGHEIQHKLLNQITYQDCENFYNYMRAKKSVSKNSAFIYYRTFRSVLLRAFKAGIIRDDQTKNFQPDPQEEAETIFLTEAEIEKLMATPIEDKYTDIRAGFLFSCFSGLRKSDVEKLTFKEVEDGNILIKQKKTKKQLRLKLHPNAMAIIEKQKKKRPDSEFVFDLKSYTPMWVGIILRRWGQAAGVKDFVFHSGRHSFGTLYYRYSKDIYLTQKAMGHRLLSTTQRYAKIVDEQLDQGIDSMPTF